jgi:DNA-binding MarR family transcriptional regulator
MNKSSVAASRRASAPEPVDTLVALVCTLRVLQLSERDHPWLTLPLTLAQLKTMMLLIQTGGMPARRLAERLGIGPSAVTPLVDRLVEQKLVRRDADPNDRRIIWVRPTAKAAAVRERVMEANRSLLADVLDALPPREQIEIQGSLKRLLASAEQLLAQRQRSQSARE